MHKLNLIISNPLRIVLAIAVILIAGGLYMPVLKNWFYSDDTFWIWASATTQFHEIFFVPERYRAMASNFTPMLGLSFKIDWNIFGLNPVGYSIHSLLSLSAATVALYFFLRLYMPIDRALVGITLFLLNPITLSITNWYSTRHYIEGLFWALLSLHCFVRAEKAGKIPFLSGIFYLLASLNKEVYVVLPAVAFIISKQNILVKLKHTIPLWVGLIIYTLWRIWIMGGIGGYPGNQPFSISVLPELFIKTISFFSLNWFGSLYAVMYVIFALVFISSFKHPKVLAIFLVLLIPILPVSSIFDAHHYTGRYFFHVSVFMICLITFIYDRIMTNYNHIYRAAAFFVILVIAILNIKQDINLIKTIRSERIQSENSALVFLSSEKSFIKSEQSSWFYESLRNIYREFSGQVVSTQLVPIEPLLKYANIERLREIREAGIPIPIDMIISEQERLIKGHLTVWIALDNYKLSWNFGPHKDSEYSILTGKAQGLYYERYGIQPSGSIMLSKMHRDGTPEVVYIKILCQPAGQGHEIISDEFAISVPGHQEIQYRSPSH